MMRPVAVLFVSWTFCIVCAVVDAGEPPKPDATPDQITLKSGKTIKGFVFMKTTDKIYMRSPDGTITGYDRKDILKTSVKDPPKKRNPHTGYEQRRRLIRSYEYDKNLALAKWCRANRLDGKARAQIKIAAKATEKETLRNVLVFSLQARYGDIVNQVGAAGLKIYPKERLFSATGAQFGKLTELHASLKANDVREKIASTKADRSQYLRARKRRYSAGSVVRKKQCSKCRGKGETGHTNSRKTCTKCWGTGSISYRKKIKKRMTTGIYSRSGYQTQMAKYATDLKNLRTQLVVHRDAVNKDIAAVCDSILKSASVQAASAPKSPVNAKSANP